ncbi:MAG: Smr/MutS family protein [Treponema sp.]|jgi:DNA mismatch repair protein MutS2|nr:Smr/MutS family protein [Treponema sp.]
MKKSKSALELLEFDAVRRSVAERALSAEAAALLLEEVPLSEGAAVRERKDLVAALCGRLKSGELGPGEELPCIAFLFPRLELSGAVLDTDEAYALGLFAERGEELRKNLAEGGETESPLKRLASEIPSGAPAAALVFAALDREGKVRDTPEMKKIRLRIRELGRELERVAGRFAAGEDTRRMLQSEVPSQRDGRLVLAVKANFRGRIRGVVHEVSATGQTIFVEPEASVEINNKLLIEQGKLETEIRRALRELSARIAGLREDLKAFHRGILGLEILRAKARYSLDTGGIFAAAVPPGPEAGVRGPGEGGLALVQARHPLLGAGAVPIDLRMDSSMLIITGPNTGGKTVTLKTLGLLALMNQTGLALPAAEGTVLPVFDSVHADIGDEQSLSQSLSTFSAHMTNIASIISASSGASLVLLDELGSGTDPEEGCAIAMAVLDHFIEKKSTVLVTTHHGVLKDYGYSRSGVENASVEFDGRTLSPTFRIILGVPGESRALDIAARNGLPPELLAKARGYLEGERTDLSALISGLKEKHRALDGAALAAREEEKRLREARRQAELRELSLRQEERLLKVRGAGELRLLLAESRKRLENLVREIREGELDREKTLKVKEFLGKLAEDSAAVDKDLKAGEEVPGGAGAEVPDGGTPRGGKAGRDGPPPALALGVEVLAGPSRRRGRILRRDRGDRTWLVEIGSVKVSFPEEALIPAQAAPEQKLLIAAEFASPPEPRLELPLRGMRLEEALEALDRQLDAAVLTGLKGFAVIHGKGDGILRKGVQDFLARSPAVAEYHFSRPELGGAGRTEVVLAD